MLENDEFEQIEAEIVPVSIVEGQDKAAVNSMVATAHQYPRNIARVKSNLLALVQMDMDTAESCGYSLPRGNKNISGPSVHLANITAQCYGNIRTDAKIVEIGDRTVTCQATAWDFESNIAARHEVIRRITDKEGKKFNDDLITLTANAAMSIARRNAILAVIPRSLWWLAYQASIRFVVGDVSDEDKLNNRRREVLNRIMEAYGVPEKDIFAVLKINTMAQMTVDHIRILIGYGNSIKEGESTVDQVFYPYGGRQDTEAAKTASKSAIDNIKNRRNQAQ